MKKTDKISAINSVKVIVSPWQKGFTCGIIMDTKSKMSTEQYELCSTIARGMIKMATSDPHSTFLWGLRGFAEFIALILSVFFIPIPIMVFFIIF